MSEVKLTPEQIENWRKVLFVMFGPYAAMMPAEVIQKYRDKMQANVNDYHEPKKETK